uniref:Probable pectate lyase F n=1 Tax=Globisporangium ultimum (strain ATCC 200006 / CBS 805.95 / DAOM BR144) TaxID=431595 RepID=K3X5E2_GLOUD
MVNIRTLAAALFVLTFATSAADAAMPTGTWPTSKGTVKFDKPYVVKPGKPFDGGMKTYERSNVQCSGQAEGALVRSFSSSQVPS